MRRIADGIEIDPSIDVTNLMDIMPQSIGLRWDQVLPVLRAAPQPCTLYIYPDHSKKNLGIDIQRPDLRACTVNFAPATSYRPSTFYIDSINAAVPGNGAARSVFLHLLEMAKLLGAAQMELSATKIGKYSWIKYGFLPSVNSWGMLRKSIRQRAWELVRHHSILRKVQALCDNAQPKTVRTIANLSDMVLTVPTYVGDMELPLGKALLLHAHTADWQGTLSLDDRSNIGSVLAYCHKKPRVRECAKLQTMVRHSAHQIQVAQRA